MKFDKGKLAAAASSAMLAAMTCPAAMAFADYKSTITDITDKGADLFNVIGYALLTLIGGLIPSRKAAKQDPATALRTE